MTGPTMLPSDAVRHTARGANSMPPRLFVRDFWRQPHEFVRLFNEFCCERRVPSTRLTPANEADYDAGCGQSQAKA